MVRRTSRDPRWRGGAGLVVADLRAAARVLLPVSCGGCGQADEVVCERCRARVVGGTLLHRVLFDGTTVVSSASWQGPARSLVVAAKERGRTDALPVLGAALARAAAEVGWSGRRRTPSLLLVPPPSSALNRLRRGGRPTSDLAREAAGQLRRAGADVRAADLLVRSLSARDQAGLSAERRADNVRGAFRLARRLPAGLLAPGSAEEPEVPAAPVQMVVVDDLCTSGATLVACVRALRDAGADVLGAATVAAR